MASLFIFYKDFFILCKFCLHMCMCVHYVCAVSMEAV